jgi:hypothetical protein
LYCSSRMLSETSKGITSAILLATSTGVAFKTKSHDCVLSTTTRKTLVASTLICTI